MCAYAMNMESHVVWHDIQYGGIRRIIIEYIDWVEASERVWKLMDKGFLILFDFTDGAFFRTLISEVHWPNLFVKLFPKFDLFE